MRVQRLEIDFGRTEARFAHEPHQSALRAPINQKLLPVCHLARKYRNFRVVPGVENQVLGKSSVVVYLRKIYDHLCTIDYVGYDNIKKDAWRRLNAAS